MEGKHGFSKVYFGFLSPTGKELEYKRSQCSYEMIKDYHIFIDKCPKIKFKKILEC